MTFSLVARCAQTGMFGVAISSSSPAVAARCSYTRAGVGAVASQNVTDPRLGPLALDLMEDGLSASEAVAGVKERGAHIDYRQVLAIDSTGKTALHSGANSLGIFTDASGRDVVAAGNLLANEDVPAAIVSGFEGASGHLGDRLIAAMRAGRNARSTVRRWRPCSGGSALSNTAARRRSSRRAWNAVVSSGSVANSFIASLIWSERSPTEEGDRLDHVS